MTKSNHSKMLPIVAATISRRIDGCFGSTPACNVSAVIFGLQDVVVARATCSSTSRSAHSRGLSRHSPDRGCLQVSFAHFGDRGKYKSRGVAVVDIAPPLFTPLQTTDSHRAPPIATE